MTLETISANEIISFVTAIVTIFSAIAAVTPTPEPGSVWAKVYALIDFLALNVGKAKDAGTSK